MKAFHQLVYDEQMSSSLAKVYTPDQLNDTLGQFDQLTITAVVDNVSFTGYEFKIQIFHSADGRLWLPKSGTVGDAELGGVLGYTLPASSQTAYIGADNGKTPSLGLVRLRIDLGTASSAHVRVYVTGRNMGFGPGGAR